MKEDLAYSSQILKIRNRILQNPYKNQALFAYPKLEAVFYRTAKREMLL